MVLPKRGHIQAIQRHLAYLAGNRVMERWRMGDPAKVYERIELQEQAKAARSKQGRAQKAKQGLERLFTEVALTNDESEQIEGLLMIWYNYESPYRPALGAPRVSVSARDYRSSDVHSDSDDTDARLRKITAEAVAACLDSLPWQQKSAVGLHCFARQSGYSVIRNPRFTVEQAHEYYQAAKVALWPMFRKRELVR